MPASTRTIGAQCVHLFYATALTKTEATAFAAAKRLWRQYRPQDSDAYAEAELRRAIEHFLIRLPTGAYLWRYVIDV